MVWLPFQPGDSSTQLQNESSNIHVCLKSTDRQD